MRALPAIAVLATFAIAAPAAGAKIRLVGPGHQYAKPCQAIAAASAGDTVKIEAAGHYDGDTCAIGVPLTVEGIHGRPHVDAAGMAVAQGKAIWVVDADATIRNVELSGAAVADKNGAGIRYERGDLKLDRVYIHDNEDGLLGAADPHGHIDIESSEFARNGAGDGYSHNIYVGDVASFTLEKTWSHDANAGHLVKSRAAHNDILFNRLTGGAGTDSYELDIPNGGRTLVAANVIEQGEHTENPTMFAYGEEGLTHPSHVLRLLNNWFINDRAAGGTAISAAAGTKLRAVGDVFAGVAPPDGLEDDNLLGVDYTGVAVAKSWALTFDAAVAQAGALSISAKAGDVVYGTGRTTATKAGEVKLKVTPTAAGKRALRKRKKLTLTVRVSFTAADGTVARTSFTLGLRR